MTRSNVSMRDSYSGWKPLYKWSACLSAIMLLIMLLQIAVFILSPPPQSVEGFFQLYKESWIMGLLSMDLLYLINNAILVFVYLALWARLQKEKPSLCLAALVLGMIGIACYYPSNPAFEMLTLSTKYWIAQPASQHMYIAAGEALLAGYTGTAFNAYYVLNAASLLLFSAAVYKSVHFSKAIGVWGLVSGVYMIVPSSAGQLGMVFSLLSLVPWAIFLYRLILRFHAFSKLGVANDMQSDIPFSQV